MANNMLGFLLDNEGSEQNYSAQPVDQEEALRLVRTASTDKVKLVAIYEAESSCVALVPERVAKLLVPLLNKTPHALEALSYRGDVLPKYCVG